MRQELTFRVGESVGFKVGDSVGFKVGSGTFGSKSVGDPVGFCILYVGYG